MNPRHLLLALPLFALAGCADGSDTETTNVPAEASTTAPASDTSAAMTEGTNAPTEIPTWETDGPVDEAAATGRDVVLKDLDALRKAGEELFLANPELSDEAIRDEVVATSTVSSGVVADGTTGIRVTASEGATSCTGVLVFKSGAGTWNAIECS